MPRHLVTKQFLVHRLTPFMCVCRLRHLYYTRLQYVCQAFLCPLGNIFFFSSFGVAFWKHPCYTIPNGKEGFNGPRRKNQVFAHQPGHDP